jgi:hypothetical protein
MSSTRPAARPQRRGATILIMPALAALALALASACGGSPTAVVEKDATPAIPLDDDATTLPGDGAGSDPTTTVSAKGIPGALVPPFTLDRTVWFEGFKIKLVSASMPAAERTLEIEGEAENQGGDQANLYEDVRIEQDNVGIADGTVKTESTVLAGSSNALKISVRKLPTKFDPDKAVLVMGDAKHQQVRVPLKGKGPAVTGEPKVVASPAPIRIGGLVVTTETLSLRSDDPSNHKQAPRESRYVVLDGSVRFDEKTTNVQMQHFSLIPPNGAPQSPKYVNALPRDGSSQDIYAVFEMPTPLGGDYTLRIKGNFAYVSKYGERWLEAPASTDTKITLETYPAP